MIQTMFRYFMPVLLVFLVLPVRAEESREITGSATYRERIALPPGAELVIDVTGFQDTALGSVRMATEGRQVPLSFRLEVPAEVTARLQVAILLGDKIRWVSETQEIPAGRGQHDLGEILLKGYVPSGFQSVMTCADQTFRIGFQGDRAILDTGDEIFELPRVISASGAKFESADGRTMIWNKGNTARVKVGGAEYLECEITEPAQAGWTAQGNEPGWQAVIQNGRISFTLNYGAEMLDLPLPAPVIEQGAYRYDFPRFGLAISVREGICEDDMSGRAYPATVELKTSTETLRGCGGETMDLLAGPEWQVEDIDGGGVIDNSHITLAVNDEGRIFGTSGCNRYTGSFAIDGEGKINVGQLAGTMMACPEALMKQEGRFLQTLSKVDRFRIDETGALQLLLGEQVVIVARR